MPDITPDELAELRESFDHFDADSNGTIDKAEFEQLMEAIGIDMGPDELEIGFETVDTNKNGVIEFEEFVSWWRDQ